MLPSTIIGHTSFIYPLTFIISLIIISIIITKQLKKNLKVTKINKKKSTISLIYYILIVSYILYNSFLTGIPLIFLIPYILTSILWGIFSYRYSKRNLIIWQDKNDNNLYAKGGALIYLSYVLALVIRIAINFIFNGYQEIGFSHNGHIIMINHPLIHTNLNFRITLMILTDLLIMLGSGMLFGRYTRIMQYHHQNNKNSNRIG